MEKIKIKYAICIENRDSEDLEKRKVYQVRDVDAEGEGYLRVVDESGEDYLYPQSYFVLISLKKRKKPYICLNKFRFPPNKAFASERINLRPLKCNNAYMG